MSRMKTGKAKVPPSQYSVVSKIRFQLLNNGKGGRAVIEYTKHRPELTPVDLRVVVPMFCAWVDRPCNKMIRSFMRVLPSASMQQRMFLRDVIQSGFVRCPDNYVLSGERTGILRYGLRSNDEYDGYSSADSSSYCVYKNKATALDAILTRVSATRKLVGLDMVSMDHVPDELLVRLGFEIVPDVLRQGPPMWMGDASSLIQNYGINAQKETQGFLDQLQSILAAPTAKS